MYLVFRKHTISSTDNIFDVDGFQHMVKLQRELIQIEWQIFHLITCVNIVVNQFIQH